jgi:Arc/MetJ-type ribon-helix-helix transcriptional regulator
MVMETVQIRLTEKQIRIVDTLIRKGVYPNRSEAIRDAVRKLTNGE